jgi:hypothetical protein
MSTWLIEIAGTKTVITMDGASVLLSADHLSDFVTPVAVAPPAPVDLSIHVRPVDRVDAPHLDATKQFTSTGWRLAQGEWGYCFIQDPDRNDPLAAATADAAFRSVDLQLQRRIFPTRERPWTLREFLFLPLVRMVLTYLLLLRDRGIVAHAAGLVANGRALMFPGRSGAGKSTFSRLLLGRRENVVVSDDRVIVCREAGTLALCGAPWPGELDIAVNRGGPLKGILFLHKATETRVREISARQALDQFLPVTSIPWYDRDLVARGIAMCEQVLTGTPVFEIHFRPDDSAVEAVRTFLD